MSSKEESIKKEEKAPCVCCEFWEFPGDYPSYLKYLECIRKHGMRELAEDDYEKKAKICEVCVND